MSGRADFNTKSEEILGFFDTYETLRCCQLDKFFPGSRKNIDYLIKNKRLYKSAGGAYLSNDENPNPDKSLIAALGVLGDVMDKIKTHSKATAPVQISFIANNNDFYEIVYVALGIEAMVMAAFDVQQGAKQARQQMKGYLDTTKRIVIVEDKSQMERLQIPGTVRYALVAPDGSLSYYKA